jgi:hypothetical protein
MSGVPFFFIGPAVEVTFVLFSLKRLSAVPSFFTCAVVFSTFVDLAATAGAAVEAVVVAFLF